MSTGIDFKLFPFAELRLAPNPRPRDSISPESIKEMADSVLQHGIIQPILVRMGSDGHPEAYAGQRRYLGFEQAIQRAAAGERCEADLSLVPCVVRDIDDRTMREHQWIENLQRVDVHPRDEARGYAELREVFGYTIDEISRKIGKAESYVSHRISLVTLPDLFWKAVDSGKLTISHLEIAATVPTTKNQEDFGRAILGGEFGDRVLTVREAQELKAREFVKSLRGCGFDRDDDKLLPIEHVDGKRVRGGSCVMCEFMTGNVKAPSCTNIGCFLAKQNAAFEGVKRNAAESGRRVMNLDQTTVIFDEVGELRPSSGFVDLAGKPGYEETGHYDEEGVPSWEELHEGTQAEALAILARHPRTNRVVLILEREEAIRLAVERDEKTAKIFENRPNKPKAVKSVGQGTRSGEADGAEEEGDQEQGPGGDEPGPSAPDIWETRAKEMDGFYEKLFSPSDVGADIWKAAAIVAARGASPVLMGRVLDLERNPKFAKSLKSEMVEETLRGKPMTVKEAQGWLLLAIVADDIMFGGSGGGQLVTALSDRVVRETKDYRCDECGADVYVPPGMGKAKACKLGKGMMRCKHCEGEWEREADFDAANGLKPRGTIDGLAMKLDGLKSKGEREFAEHLTNDYVIISKPNEHGVLKCCATARIAVEKKGFIGIEWGTDHAGQWFGGLEVSLPTKGSRTTTGFSTPCSDIFATRGEAVCTQLADIRHNLAVKGVDCVQGVEIIDRVLAELKRVVKWEPRDMSVPVEVLPPPAKKTEELFTCEKCGQGNLTKRGLASHNCAKRLVTATPEPQTKPGPGMFGRGPEKPNPKNPGHAHHDRQLAKATKEREKVGAAIKAKARALYDEGKGKDAIAKELGISPNTVGNWQKREWPKRNGKK